ncbi:hypothetical protein EV360DRAFT_77580 [Lentinula raphanica]|nr:hypothetical protein EV360DRAFT_77580 [Lentinula raphanica]
MSRIKFWQYGSNSRSFVQNAGTTGAGGEKKSRLQLFRPSSKPESVPVPPTWADLPEHVLRTLNNAAQFTSSYPGGLSDVALSILKAVREAKKNQKVLGELAKSACNLASLVLKFFEEPYPDSSHTAQHESSSISSNPTLDAHIEQSFKTLQNIDTWVKNMNSRTFIRRIISFRSDLPVIQGFQDQLRKSMDELHLQIRSLMALHVRSSASRMVDDAARQRVGDIQEGPQSDNTRGPLPNSPTFNSTTPISSESHTPPYVNISSAASLNTSLDSETPVPFDLDFEASVSPHHSYQGNTTFVQNIVGDYTVNSIVNNSVRRNYGNTYTVRGQNVNLERQQPVFQDDQYYDDSRWTSFVYSHRLTM